MELLVGIGLILLVLFAEIGLYQKYGLRGLSYRCQFSDAHATEGETVSFTETVTNDKALPIPWMKAELTLSPWLDFPESHSTVSGSTRFVTGFFSVRGHARVSRVWQVTCEKRGVYAVEHVVLVTADLLGAVRLSLPAEELGGTLMVFPRRFCSAGLLLPKCFRTGMGERPVAQSIFSDPFLTAGIRPYAAGDAWNQIHWKASAHAGTLLVRKQEPTAQKTMTILLCLETHPADAGRMTQDAPLQEHTIRVCAQCLWEALQQGWSVRLCIGESGETAGGIRTQYGIGASMYRQSMALLAQLRLESLLSMPKLLAQGAPSGWGEQLLLVTPYSDASVAAWKQRTHGAVAVTGNARDLAHCADCLVPEFSEGGTNA